MLLLTRVAHHPLLITHVDLNFNPKIKINMSHHKQLVAAVGTSVGTSM